MLVIKLFSVVLSLQIVWALSLIEEKYLSNQLLEYFDEESSEINEENTAAGQQKREAAQTASAEDRFASLFSNLNLTQRANHYWTRKRGRENTTPPPSQTVWEIYYTLYPPRRSIVNIVNNQSSLRKKRETFVKFLNKISSRAKREVESEIVKGEKEISDESPKTLKLAEDKNKKRPNWASFGRKLNRCCEQENESSGINQTLLSAKAECMTSARKTMNKFNISEDTIDGDGGLYNMFSCERTNRWKTMVTCTINCVANKIGMFDSKGAINIETAKRVVIENFAKQTWEQDASNNLVEKCAQTVMKSTSKDIDAYGLECSSKPAEFAYCVWREMFLTCPEDKQDKTRPCEKLRTVLTKFDDNKFKN